MYRDQAHYDATCIQPLSGLTNDQFARICEYPNNDDQLIKTDDGYGYHDYTRLEADRSYYSDWHKEMNGFRSTLSYIATCADYAREFTWMRRRAGEDAEYEKEMQQEAARLIQQRKRENRLPPNRPFMQLKQMFA